MPRKSRKSRKSSKKRSSQKGGVGYTFDLSQCGPGGQPPVVSYASCGDGVDPQGVVANNQVGGVNPNVLSFEDWLESYSGGMTAFILHGFNREAPELRRLYNEYVESMNGGSRRYRRRSSRSSRKRHRSRSRRNSRNKHRRSNKKHDSRRKHRRSNKKHDSRRKHRRRKQRGGNNFECASCNVSNRNFGCSQPNWQPDCL